MHERLGIDTIDWEIVHRILRTFLPVESHIWIFGSRARGSHRRASDLDLAVDAGRPLTPDERLSLADAFEISELPWRVDIIDMYETEGIFRKNVESDRIPLWLGDESPEPL